MDARIDSMIVVTGINTKRKTRLNRDINSEIERRENLMKQLQDIRSPGTNSAAAAISSSRNTAKSKFLAAINAKIMNDKIQIF